MFVSFPRSAALLACIACLPAVANEQHYNQISLRAEANSEVAPDRMHVTLYTESQHEEPGQLAKQTTQAINKALQQARRAEGVTVSQGSRSSYPVYEEKGQQISAWRERAELRLESGDFAALSKLTGELMQDLKMGGMRFSVSNAVRQENEDALLKNAVEAFRARAQLATKALGGSDYRIVSLNLNSGGNYQPETMRAMTMKTMGDMPTPDIEAGTRQISVNAEGVIEVQMP